MCVGCDNYYNGAVLPCLSRPWLPPYSYSTTGNQSINQSVYLYIKKRHGLKQDLNYFRESLFDFHFIGYFSNLLCRLIFFLLQRRTMENTRRSVVSGPGEPSELQTF